MKHILCVLCALAAPLVAEPPAAYVLAIAAASNVDGISGPQAGLVAGVHAKLGDSVSLIFEGAVLHSPKIGVGDGALVAAVFEIEHQRGPWFARLGASYAVQETSSYSKDAWAPRITIGRYVGRGRLSGTWSLPDSTANRTESLGLTLDWRLGRWALRPAVAWVRHRDGAGPRVAFGLGRALGQRPEL